MIRSEGEPERQPVLGRTVSLNCWSCLLGQHPGGLHPWSSDEEDEAYLARLQRDLKALGLPALTEEQMACQCTCTQDESYADDGGPDLDGPVSIHATECPVCGEQGACGYDNEGRPMIHTLAGEEE